MATTLWARTRRRLVVIAAAAAVTAVAVAATGTPRVAAVNLPFPRPGARTVVLDADGGDGSSHNAASLPSTICTPAADGGCGEAIPVMEPAVLTPELLPLVSPEASAANRYVVQHNDTHSSGCAALGAPCSAARPCCAGGASACVIDPMIGRGIPHCAYDIGAFRGTTLVPKSRWDLTTDAFDKTVQALPRAGFDCVALTFYAFMDNLNSTSFHYNYSTAGEPVSADPSSIVRAIKKVHESGMCVILKPHIAIETREWRGYVKPSTPFFNAYRSWVLGWVDVAQRNRVEAFAIGSEWKQVERDGMSWRRIIKEARTRYSGYLCYGTNWDAYQTLPFTDALDFVATSAYFEVAPPPLPWPALPTRHSYQTVLEGWKRVVWAMDGWHRTTAPNLPIVFIEAGVRSVVGAASYPWESQPPQDRDDKVDLQGQADFYTAMFEAVAPYTWWRGQFSWEWLWGSATQQYGGPRGTGYSVQGKPAEAVLRRRIAGKTRRALSLARANQGTEELWPLRISFPKTPL
ncbi:hypothetical protein MMPV_009331 [Pyropia vietnamensis]